MHALGTGLEGCLGQRIKSYKIFQEYVSDLHK